MLRNMLRNPRQLLMIVGAAIFVVGAILAWRAAHPPLTPEQQIAVNLDEIRTGIENRNKHAVMKYLSDDFSWQGASRQDASRVIGELALRGRDVQLTLSNQRTKIEGDRATVTGHFRLTYHPEEGAPLTTHAGEFKTSWELQNGRWKIVSGQGGQGVAP